MRLAHLRSDPQTIVYSLSKKLVKEKLVAEANLLFFATPCKRPHILV